MDDLIERQLASTLLRVVEKQPRLSLEEAEELTLEMVNLPENKGFTEENAQAVLQDQRSSLKQRGVPNPTYLKEKYDYGFHFFLANAPPGWLEQLREQTDQIGRGLSLYTLYGVWDSLTVLVGTTQEAQRVEENIESALQVEVERFSALNVSYYHRFKPSNHSVSEFNLDIDKMNNAIMDYDRLQSEERERLENEGILLGPRYFGDKGFEQTRIDAYVGISYNRGGQGLTPERVRNALLERDTLSSCLVHLFQPEGGTPFPCFAKISCRNLEEFDQATDEISETKVDLVKLSGTTFLVANGNSELPELRSRGIHGPEDLTPDIRPVHELSERLGEMLPPETINTFNQIDRSRLLVILQVMEEHLRKLDKYGDQNEPIWSPNVHDRSVQAVKMFGQEAVEDPPHVGGAVMKLFPLIEKKLASAMDEAAYKVFNEKSQVQQELKLSNADFSELSFYDLTEGLKTMEKHDKFSFLHDSINKQDLARFDQIREVRNRVSHEKDFKGDDIKAIQETGQSIAIGMDILAWIESDILPAVESYEGNNDGDPTIQELSPPPNDRGSSTFLCHSSQDKNRVENVAQILQGFDYSVWYDEWAIDPGEQIVDKIEEGLSQMDVLVVFLTPASVDSKWVQRELNTALMKQLSDQNVTVIPVLLEDCDIPSTLRQIKYIDLRDSFEEGIYELMSTLDKKLSNSNNV